MSSLEEIEKVVIKEEETNECVEVIGNKRKSPTEATNGGDENSEAENSPSKRVKSEEPGSSIKAEPNPESPVQIKAEPVEEADEPAAEPTSSDSAIPMKTEPTANGNSPAAAVGKMEPTSSNGQADDDSSVSSSSIRNSCRFGIRCYRRNPAHRSAEAHPGDQDYRRPNFPEPPLGTPACPFGNACYRRNPVHFQEHSHPAD
ncbi:aprataxin and PNK-like factor isoform X3 [Drosophila biarmipes]|nr:aprataxin and PNK-like factor isoform X3 [Drosophila biarmipes]